ncbi:MAG: class I SAM-dependent methyltransferase [Gaiellaceae bacterium]
MVGGMRFFDDTRYLRTVRAERRPPSAARCVPGSVILDAGCGEGRNAVPLARAGYRVVGLDRSRRLLEAAPRHARLRLVCGSYEQMPFRDSTFDAVLLLGTALGYSAEAADRRALSEARRVLAPGGRLVVETLHRDEIGDALREHEERELPARHTLCFDRRFDRRDSVLHEIQSLDGGTPIDYELRVYSAKDLVSMVEDAGFEIVSVEATPVTPLVLVGRSSPP